MSVTYIVVVVHEHRVYVYKFLEYVGVLLLLEHVIHLPHARSKPTQVVYESKLAHAS